VFERDSKGRFVSKESQRDRRRWLVFLWSVGIAIWVAVIYTFPLSYLHSPHQGDEAITTTEQVADVKAAWLADLLAENAKLKDQIEVMKGQLVPDEYQKQRIQKEYMRLAYTDFCGHVGHPPETLAKFLQQMYDLATAAGHQQDMMPLLDWWNNMVNHYNEAKCGDT
jgi:hypothetical protein